MKKLMIILAGLLVISCSKKGYNCECGKYNGEVEVFTHVSKVDKSEATEWCNNAIQYNYDIYSYCKLVK